MAKVYLLNIVEVNLFLVKKLATCPPSYTG